MKNVIILGSTGSIGTQALEVIKNLKNIKIIALSANKNIELLEKQVRRVKPLMVCVFDKKKAIEFKEIIKDLNIKVLFGLEGLIELACYKDYDILLNSLVGSIGLLPTIKAIENKKDIALANKETLVTAGEIVMQKAKENNISIYPIDSEHSAIFQCLQGGNIKEVSKIILTASGGAFRDYESIEQLKNVTISDALKHPNWSMGKKITIDCATLMNKGLEVIEAKHLFDLPLEKIDVLIHPESIIHSMIEYEDSAIIAQLGTPDMKVPIQYALTYPKRIKNDFEKLDFFKIKSLTFKEPNYKLFPCLKLAFDAIKIGKTMPAVLNASNEIAVLKFLKGEISFNDIPILIKKAMMQHIPKEKYKLEDIIAADEWARGYTLNL